MSVEWTPAMSTGVEEVDVQHREFLRRLNQLIEAILAGAGNDKVGPLFGYLGEYVTLHFSSEESCMNRFHCPVAAKNVAAHAKFIETFQRLRARHASSGADARLLVEVQRDLADWFVNHICSIDVQMKPYAQGPGGKT